MVEAELGDDPAPRSPSEPGRRGSRSTWPDRRASPRASWDGRARSGPRPRFRRSSAPCPSRAPSPAARSGRRRAARAGPPAAVPPPRPAGWRAAARAGRPMPRGRETRASRRRTPASCRRRGPGSRARGRPQRPPRRPKPVARQGRGRRCGRAAHRSRPCRSSGGSPPARRRARRRPRSVPSSRRDRAGRTTTAAALRPRPPTGRPPASRRRSRGPTRAGTRWNASARWRPIASSPMSVPTIRTSRSPFSRSARIRAAVPGAPQAETRTVIGFRATARAPRGCPPASGFQRGPSRRCRHPTSPASRAVARARPAVGGARSRRGAWRSAGR